MTPAALTPQKRRSGFAPLAAALAALMVVVAGGAWWFLNANRPASVAAKTPNEAARLSIVVLPFANASGDPGQDYLVDALTDELTTSLARLRDTFVIARNTAMTFKGKPAQAKPIKSAVPKPSLLAPLAATLAALAVVIAGGAWWFLNANRPATVAASAAANGTSNERRFGTALLIGFACAGLPTSTE